jgi:hypothetical protein
MLPMHIEKNSGERERNRGAPDERIKNGAAATDVE